MPCRLILRQEPFFFLIADISAAATIDEMFIAYFRGGAEPDIYAIMRHEMICRRRELMPRYADMRQRSVYFPLPFFFAAIGHCH